MGSQCATGSGSLREDFHFACQSNTKAFGLIKIFRSDRTHKQIAVKRIDFNALPDLIRYKSLADLAKGYDNIPTLVKITSYSEPKKTECGPISLQINFQYLPRNFGESLLERKILVGDYLNRNRRQMDMLLLSKLKMDDYEAVDRLPLLERKYASLHFLQGEILRMIDHIIGAVYFLNHFQSQHSAIRPDHILLDDEGKFVLVDRHVFRLQTNYERALRLGPISYLSPEQFLAAKTRDLKPQRQPDKSDIFVVGLIALEMATLDSLDKIYDWSCWRVNQDEINRLLLKAQHHYSQDFMQLLQQMLQLDESQRIDFSHLIDNLSPILTRNLEDMNRVYGNAGSSDDLSFVNGRDMHTQGEENNTRATDLQKRLTELEESYHRVMASKVLNDNSIVQEASLKADQDRLISKIKSFSKSGGLKQQPVARSSKSRVSAFRKNPLMDVQMGKGELWELYLKEYHSIRKSREKVF